MFSIPARFYRFACRQFPNLTGTLFYHGVKVYIPRSSYSVAMIRSKGGFESFNIKVLEALVAPNSWFFDIGANLGLMSIPVLAAVSESHVLAFEPSPNSLPFLTRTIRDSRFTARWRLVPKAAGCQCGRREFNISEPENAEFDGLLNTARVKSRREVQVEVTTVDEEWARLGKPLVSAIKCDVEGAETLVLRGAKECLKQNRPFVLLEWNKRNLDAYTVNSDALLGLAMEFESDLYALPHLVSVKTHVELNLQMIATESFLLAPWPRSLA